MPSGFSCFMQRYSPGQSSRGRSCEQKIFNLQSVTANFYLNFAGLGNLTKGAVSNMLISSKNIKKLFK